MNRSQHGDRRGRGFRGGGSSYNTDSRRDRKYENKLFVQMDEIQVLNQELELLKKKRELLEMQKSVQSYKPNHNNGGSSYSNRYDSYSGQSGPSQQGWRKRPSDPQVTNPQKGSKMARQESPATSFNSRKHQYPTKTTDSPLQDPTYIIKKGVTLPLGVLNQLKLAAGMILKNIKISQTKPIAESNVNVLRKLILARLYHLMMDQVIGRVNEMIHLYHATYSSNFDQETLSLVLAIKAKGLIQAKTPEEEFNMFKNMEKRFNEKFLQKPDELTNYIYKMTGDLLSKKLDGMFDKMKTLSKDDGESASELKKIEYSGIVGAKDDSDLEIKLKKYEDLIGSLIMKKMPSILPNFKNKIISILKTIEIDDVPVDSDPVQSQETVKKTQETNVIYNNFVTVKAVPVLPEKAILKDFLKSFKPDTIKKHKDIDNIIFVGFKDENSYNNILEADGTVVDNISLIIKPSKGLNDNIIKKTNTKNTTNAENTNDVDASVIIVEEPKYPVIELDADLDGQINDLLKSIQQAENNQSRSNSFNDSNNECVTDDQASEENAEKTADVQEGKEENSNENGQYQDSSEVEDLNKGNNEVTDEGLAQQAPEVENVDAQEPNKMNDVNEAGDEKITANANNTASEDSKISTRRSSRLKQT